MDYLHYDYPRLIASYKAVLFIDVEIDIYNCYMTNSHIMCLSHVDLIQLCCTGVYNYSIL